MKPLSGGLRSRKSKLGLLSTLSAILLRRDRLAFETKGPIKTAVNKSVIRSKRSRPRDDKGGSSEPRSRPDGLKRMERTGIVIRMTMSREDTYDNEDYGQVPDRCFGI